MLDDLEDGQVYLMRNLHGSINLRDVDEMTRPELLRWVAATSRIIKRELGKNADDYVEPPGDPNAAPDLIIHRDTVEQEPEAFGG